MEIRQSFFTEEVVMAGITLIFIADATTWDRQLLSIELMTVTSAEVLLQFPGIVKELIKMTIRLSCSV